MKGLFVTGTDTDVGKTWVGTQLIKSLKARNVNVKPRKPIESGWPDSENIQSTDSWKLSEAADCINSINIVCPNRFSTPVSPVRAARIASKKLTISTVKQQCLSGITEDDFLYVEGAGGFYSPFVEDGLNADLASQLSLPVVLIANNKLGCISQVLLCCGARQRRQLNLRAVILNQVDPNTNVQAMNNQEDIAEYINQPVFSLRHEQDDLPAPLIDLLY